MHECIILYREVGQELLEYVHDPEDPIEIAIFPHQDAAVAYCETAELFKDGRANYQIVELDEL